jgi:SAM-dependent methyltransferase
MPKNGQLDRISLAQTSLDALGRGTYLEIGVDTGASFFPIKAKRKWGVDPSYRLTRRRRFMYTVMSNLQIRVERLFRMTSDEFFVRNESLLASHRIDVCLVDGLHTYSQALNDVLNVLKYLKPKGVILVHDCNPPTELMARPAAGIENLINQNIPDWNGAWSGDVWKALVHLRALRNDVKAFVLDCDTGIGVVTKGSPTDSLSYTEADIHAMDYSVLCGSRKALLGLQPSEYFEGFLRSHLRVADAAD